MLRRSALYGIIVLYLLTTLSGFLFAVLRVRIPHVPETLMQWSYRSMAPWQGYQTHHRELIAIATHEDGSAENVALTPYFPFRTGQRMVMQEFASFDRKEERDAAYILFARRVLKAEQRNHLYVSLELRRISWPMAPEGRTAMKKDPYITSELLTKVP